jgi:iron-sulfur cluster repair protein YtfE (RIC family)
LSHLTAHIVDAFHEPLRQELPRLSKLEQLMQLHIHLEHNVLSPRAAALVPEAGIERS